ncbi:MAG: LacI family DNA-binding transcriptional regulator [Gulosibacter sp.]
MAAAVGVSREAVGIAFRGKSGISDETRRRIFEVADHLGYRPNTAAQTLRRASTKLIGVVFSPEHLADLDIIQWMHGTAKDSGFTVVTTTATKQHPELAAIDELAGYSCEAIVLIAPVANPADIERAALGIPIVVVGRDFSVSGFDTVRSQGAEGIARLVKHLAELGHKEIVYLHGPQMFEAKPRLEGYRAGMRSSGLTQRIINMLDGYTETAGAKVAQSLLNSHGSLPTALVCSNDQAAHGAMQELRRLGILVPNEVSITGYDNIRSSQLSFIDLTTAHQDPLALAEAVIRTAVTRISDSPKHPIESLIDSPVLVRGSTARPRML